VIAGIFESALLRFRDGCAESGEDDDVVRLLLENVLRAFLYESSHLVSSMRTAIGPPWLLRNEVFKV
jgi:hypothetical protein